jgi:hypothetical protein
MLAAVNLVSRLVRADSVVGCDVCGDPLSGDRSGHECAGRVRRAATLVVGYLGDTFVVTMSALRRDVVTSTVLDDVDWTAARCAELAIVAHSQGAVPSHDALRRRTPANLTHFLTFGAGLEKLLRLRLLFRSDRGAFRRQWVGVTAGALLVIAILVALSAASAGRYIELIWASGIAAGLALVWSAGIALAFKNATGYEDLVRLAEAGEQFTWLSLYASSDPVPNGPLIDEAPEWISECEVFNYASIIRDHTAYLKNRDEVVPRIALTLLNGLLPDDLDDAPAIERAQTRRRMRVRLLTLGRTLISSAAISSTVIVWPSLGQFRQTVREHLPLRRSHLGTSRQRSLMQSTVQLAGERSPGLLLGLSASRSSRLSFRFSAASTPDC